MADEFTDNYGLFLPKGSDSMADVRKNLTNSFDKLEPRANPTLIANQAALPQVGDFEIGDRVFRQDTVTGTTYPSSYILVCKDSSWGWHWRPVQQVLSPWISLTDNVILDIPSFEVHPFYGLQIALDSRGFCHWRGVVRRKTAGIPTATSFSVFKPVPVGIRPNVNFMHTVAVSPVQSGTGEAGYSGGRIYMQQDGASSMRFYNTNNGISQDCWLTGLKYNNSAHWYFSG